MCRSVAYLTAVAATAGLTACGGNSTKADRDCFRVWNTSSNQARQATVANRFETTKRYLSISGEWKGRATRWGVPPSQHGSWSAEQQAAVHDNATVDADGLLRHRSER